MGRIMKEVIVSYVVNTYVNVTMCPPVQLLYADKKLKQKLLLLKKKKKSDSSYGTANAVPLFYIYLLCSEPLTS
jgi:hypothetical protein